ncbi:hypothetical protein M7I_3404 [Glarea lozoyensis 74030]|uniref:G protein-coupled receptor GPR1/2/3 C-terminal domain-containing protein n=1 Tax=Glarea lozoyensis (strain ATCC 74030 / MF5533) TaxID=1104152 RepID=H0ELE1_GLAL7|nr:hypothetical protein M7I_3404 [Glarea lozoyensis 74030]
MVILLGLDSRWTYTRADEIFRPCWALGTTTTIVSQTINDPFAVSRQKILRTARYMIVYPIAYIILTLPLAAGRVASMTGRKPPLMFFCVAGAMMASCGFVDVALYIYTRKALSLFDLFLISVNLPWFTSPKLIDHNLLPSSINTQPHKIRPTIMPRHIQKASRKDRRIEIQNLVHNSFLCRLKWFTQHTTIRPNNSGCAAAR